MTSKILNNVISSRSCGDISKLFWTCLFVQVFFWPNSFPLLFSTSLSALSPGVLLVWCSLLGVCLVWWLVGVLFVLFLFVWGVFVCFLKFPFAFQFFFFHLLLCGWCCFWFIYVCITIFSLISHGEQLIKISIWDKASSLKEARSILDVLWQIVLVSTDDTEMEFWSQYKSSRDLCISTKVTKAPSSVNCFGVDYGGNMSLSLSVRVIEECVK